MPRKPKRHLKLVHKELKKLRDNKISPVQLKQAKEKFIGQIALAEESRMSLIIIMAKSLLILTGLIRWKISFAKINAVTAENLLEISNEIFDNDAYDNLIISSLNNKSLTFAP
jgi:predicted Zn-dependent peptidase